MELVGRGVFWAQGHPYSGSETGSAIRSSLDRMRQHTPGLEAPIDGAAVDTIPIMHPYIGWETLDGQQRVAQDAAYFQTELADQDFDVLVLGSSVAAGFANRGQRAFTRALQRDPRLTARKIRLLRYGRGAFKQPQHLMMLGYLISLGFDPDAVICIDGVNELAMAALNLRRNAHPIYPSVPQWSQAAQGGALDQRALELLLALHTHEARGRRLKHWIDRTGATYSVVLGNLARGWMARIQADWVAQQERYADHIAGVDSKLALRGPSFEGNDEDAMMAGVRSWERASASMAAICRDRAIPYLHILQPTLHDVGSKPLSPEEQARADAPEEWIRGARLGYPLLRRAGAQLREHGIPFVDASRIFEHTNETCYVDAGHYNPKGYEILAELVASKLLDTLAGDR